MSNAFIWATVVAGGLAAAISWSNSINPPVATEGEPMLHPSDLRVSGPDQFGVVCYSFGSRAISCVQVVMVVATPKEGTKP